MRCVEGVGLSRLVCLLRIAVRRLAGIYDDDDAKNTTDVTVTDTRCIFLCLLDGTCPSRVGILKSSCFYCGILHDPELNI